MTFNPLSSPSASGDLNSSGRPDRRGRESVARDSPDTNRLGARAPKLVRLKSVRLLQGTVLPCPLGLIDEAAG